MYVLRQKVAEGGYPAVVLVHSASPEEGEAFFAKRWPGALALSDPQKHLYAAFGLQRGRLGQFAGPRAVWAALKGLVGGHGVGKPQGDPLMMSGRFLIHERSIVWRDLHDHAGAGTDDRGMLEVYAQLPAKA